MSDEVRAAVFGNVGTMLTFRVGAYDADVLEKEFNPQFYAQDLVNLGFTQIYLKLMIDGVGSTPFSATTLPPISPPEMSYKDHVIRSSQKTYGRPRAEVEEFISEWHAVKKPEQNMKKDTHDKKSSPLKRNPQKTDQRKESDHVKRPKMEESKHKEQFSEISKKLAEDKKKNQKPESGEKSDHKDNKKTSRNEKLKKDKESLRDALSSVLGSQQKVEGLKESAETKEKPEQDVSKRHESKKTNGSQQTSNVKKNEQKEIPEGELRKVLDIDEGK